jgi:hypothetical protein
VIDRGAYSLPAIELLRKLQKEAISAGGEVIRLCGNHELMVLQHNFNYAKLYITDPDSLLAELIEEIGQGYLRASYTDGERLYTHAGLRSAIRDILMAEMKSVKPQSKSSKINLLKLSDHINKTFRDCVEKGDLDNHPIFHIGHDRWGSAAVGGIFWCDFKSTSASAEAWVIPQIFGHSPSRKNSLNTAHGLKLIDVDAGMHHGYGGARVYIEITPEGQLLQHSKESSRWTVKKLTVK